MRDLWGIVLAGGEGTRLLDLTRAVHGRDVPKQFARLGSARSLLQQTMERISPLIPGAQTAVVVAESWATLAHRQLREREGVRTISQPENRGTAAGLMLPLAHVLACDPEARVVVFPSDHSFRHADLFLEAVRRAVEAADETPGSATLIGAVADRPATDLGWIVAGAAHGNSGARAVLRFVEKPPAPASEELMRRGALWNTLVIAARGADLLWLVARYLPELAGPFARYRCALGGDGATALLRRMYAELRAADFSREVLAPADGLRVVEMSGAGWCDCGTPERLFATLAPDELARLQRQLAHHDRRDALPRL